MPCFLFVCLFVSSFALGFCDAHETVITLSSFNSLFGDSFPLPFHPEMGEALFGILDIILTLFLYDPLPFSYIKLSFVWEPIALLYSINNFKLRITTTRT